MSIFAKSVIDITFDDLKALLTDSARESVRLEFKSKVPKKDETLKKLSSMANTYGGYLIIGAAEDGKGNLDSLTGVEFKKNYDRTIHQWCFESIYPPVVPAVSQPIKLPSDPSKCVYVIYVEESANSPHFLNERNGCYVRVDEHSQKFEPLLATLTEIEFLQNRRERSVLLRESLFSRAQGRFFRNRNMSADFDRDFLMGEKKIPKPSISISVIPKFPGSSTFDFKKLRDFVAQERLTARFEKFPNGVIESQPDGFFFSNPRIIEASYFEADIHGFIYYAQELTPNIIDAVNIPTLRVADIFAWVVFYLCYARQFYTQLAYDGTLVVRIQVDRISGFQFIMPFPSKAKYSAKLDESIKVETEFSSLNLRMELKEQLSNLYRKFCFSCGHAGAYNADESTVQNVWFKPCLEKLEWSSLDDKCL